MSVPQQTVIPWSVFARWVLATAIGFGIGVVAGYWLTMLAASVGGVNEDHFLIYGLLIGIGLAVGICQWRAMTPFFPGAWRWVPATLAGYWIAIISFTIAKYQNFFVTEWGGSTLLLLGMGSGAGLAQWWVLRKWFNYAGLWILACGVGFLSFLWLETHPVHSLDEGIFVGATLGGLAAIPSGLVLAWLLRQPKAVSL